MRIIGGHDYYDGVVGFDSDRDRVFLRDKYDLYENDTKRGLVIPGEPFQEGYAIHHTGYHRYYDEDYIDTKTKKRYRLKYYRVYFCGKLYRYLSLNMVEIGGFIGTVEKYITTVEDYQDFLDRFGFTMIKRPKKKQWYMSDGDYYADNLADFFKPIAILSDYFTQNGIICAVPYKYENVKKGQYVWAINTDGLDRIGFPKVMPAWQAYQEIDMYLGTILVDDQDRMVKLSDDRVLAKHGFDKWSFRNKVHPAKPRGNAA